MNLNPVELLKLVNPVFYTLDDLISNYGVYLYFVSVWLSLGAIAWVFNGGLRRKDSHDNAATMVPGIITMHPPNQSPPPIIIANFDSVQNHDNEKPDEP